MLTHGSIFLLQCILLGIMYFIFRIEAFNGTGISLLGNFLTFVSAAAFFSFRLRSICLTMLSRLLICFVF